MFRLRGVFWPYCRCLLYEHVHKARPRLCETELAAAARDCDSAAPGARGSPDEPECFHAAWVFRCCPQDASWCSLSPQTPVSTWVSVFAIVLLQKVAMGTESWPLGEHKVRLSVSIWWSHSSVDQYIMFSVCVCLMTPCLIHVDLLMDLMASDTDTVTDLWVKVIYYMYFLCKTQCSCTVLGGPLKQWNH